MAQAMNVKRNDTGPPVVITVMDGTDIKSLVGATTVKFIMGTLASDNTPTAKVTRTMTITDAANGLVTVDWITGDLDTVATYKAEIEVTWSTGLKQTFPAAGYLTVNVLADLG